ELCLTIVLSPLVGAVLAGLLGRVIGRSGAHWATIIGVGLSFVLSLRVFQLIVLEGEPALNTNLYTWLEAGGVAFHVGFLVDQLTATMMLVVTFVSWMVHVYTIGYMHDDPGYQRFFSYISLFTFSMLMLVMSNNFMQLFFGWEAVGLVSYLLIGFWFKRDTAIYANLKAFLVNRVGDFGFLLGIAAVLGVGFILAAAILAPKAPDPEKLSAYECGFNAFDDARMKFDVRFYLVSILFIIFDLEVAFLFPWAVSLMKLPQEVQPFAFWSMMTRRSHRRVHL
ncbi:MAG: hypothetical protein RLZZ141_2246, partial [Pseudomonadota bacterium]